MIEMQFITIETDLHNNVEKNLLQSTKINKIPLEVVGKGYEWNGFVTKFEILKEILPTLTSDLVCLTDSRDVMYMSDANTIYNTFVQNFSIDSLVFNGETNCFPEKSFAELHPNQHKKYKYLNSGCVIGSRKLLIQIVDECLELFNKTGINDDQFLLQKIFIDGTYGDKLTLDYDCKIFQCIWDEDWGRSNNFDLIYTKDDIYNRLTDTHPLIFHHPGPTCVGSQVWKILNKTYYKVPSKQFWN